MEKGQSVLQRLGLPPEFGAALLIFSFVLSVAPYLSDTDFGILKIPALKPATLKKLRFGGPVVLLVAVLLHVPFSRAPKIAPAKPDTDPTPAVETDPMAPPIASEPAPTPVFPLEASPTPVPAPATSRDKSTFKVNLIVSSSMSQAKVWLDGREARVLRRTTNLITIEAPAGGGNAQIRLERDDGVACSMSVSMIEDGTTLTPCQT